MSTGASGLHCGRTMWCWCEVQSHFYDSPLVKRRAFMTSALPGCLMSRVNLDSNLAGLYRTNRIKVDYSNVCVPQDSLVNSRDHWIGDATGIKNQAVLQTIQSFVTPFAAFPYTYMCYIHWFNIIMPRHKVRASFCMCACVRIGQAEQLVWQYAEINQKELFRWLMFYLI